MKFSTSTLAVSLTSLLPLASAYYKGFNVAATNPDGTCKSQSDWQTAFETLAALPGAFTSVRLYASSDCNTLANAVPAALSTGTGILVGVWTEDSAHYTAEKQALEDAISQYGSDWIIAISVGSEDLYRGDTDANTLAQQIHDVRGMVRAAGVTQEVGHVDTWTAWVNSTNTAVIQACDFVGTDGYPYYQSTDISDASNAFWESIDNVRNTVNSVNPGVWVWIAETGWPVSGGDYGAAVPSVANAQTYWSEVACAAFEQAHTFWYVYQDYSDSPSFGVIGSNGQTVYSLSC